MVTRTPNTRTAARRAYARPALTVYGSVRELTGAMSGAGTDNMSMMGPMD
ncbi:MAG: lasso RiPP family leader peptide-containing protein [Novosphingobium sp.]